MYIYITYIYILGCCFSIFSWDRGEQSSRKFTIHSPEGSINNQQQDMDNPRETPSEKDLIPSFILDTARNHGFGRGLVPDLWDVNFSPWFLGLFLGVFFYLNGGWSHT